MTVMEHVTWLIHVFTLIAFGYQWSSMAQRNRASGFGNAQYLIETSSHWWFWSLLGIC